MYIYNLIPSGFRIKFETRLNLFSARSLIFKSGIIPAFLGRFESKYLFAINSPVDVFAYIFRRPAHGTTVGRNYFTIIIRYGARDNVSISCRIRIMEKVF